MQTTSRADITDLEERARGENFVKNYLELVLSTDHNLATTSITTSEIYYGAFINKWTKKRIEKVESFLSSIKIFSYNFKHSKKYGELRARLQNSGQEIGFPDTAIASICLVEHCKLITFNLKHFKRINGLELFINED